MSTLLKSKFIRPIAVQEEFRKKGILVFSFDDFIKVFHVSSAIAKHFLETYAKKGFLERLKRGLYTFKNNPPDTVIIANRLLAPSYISYEYALSFYSVIPEVTYSLTSATTKQTRSFSTENYNYFYTRVKKTAYAGYVLKETMNGEHFLIAEPEKALIDYLYLVSLGKKSLNDRLRVKQLDKKKIDEYAKLYNRPSLSKLIEKVYDQSRNN